MRAVTVRQPFAALLASGAKLCETRSRDLGARPGELLGIHASLAVEPEGVGAYRALPPDWRSRALADRGVVIAVAEVLAVGRVGLVGVVRVLRGPAGAFDGIDTSEERALGDWSAGRVLVLLGRRVVLPVPVPARGALGLWRLPEEVLLAVREGARLKPGLPHAFLPPSGGFRRSNGRRGREVPDVCQHETTTPAAIRVCGRPAAEHEERMP